MFAHLAKLEREHPLLKGRAITGVADPALWQAQTGESFADAAARHSLFFQKGDNARIPGWMQCHYRLTFDENGYPRMYVFNTCKDFIRTSPTLCYDPHEAEDLDTAQEDHIADEWRYMMMTRPIIPAPPQVEAPLIINPLE